MNLKCNSVLDPLDKALKQGKLRCFSPENRKFFLMSDIKTLLKRALAIGILAFSQATAGADALQETVSTLQEWAKTERMISEAAASWEADKASMENLITIYQEEIEALTQVIADAEKDTSAAEVLRNELLEQDEGVKKLEGQVVAALIQAENEMKTLEAVLPPPLRDELQPLFNSLPKDSKDSKLAIGQRIQPIVAILTQVQKFNQVVTLIEDYREFEAGRTVQTETIYFGLGAAFYVDQANEHAGYGVPGPDGWVWQSDNSLVSSVRSFVDIYRGTQQARYINLPVSVK